MAEFDDFYDEVRPFVRGCPQDAMKVAILRAARMFCSRSWYVLRTLEFDTEEDVAEYDMTEQGLSEQEEMLDVKFAQSDDEPMHPASLDVFDTARATTRPTHFVFTPPTTLTLYPTPNDAFEILVRGPVQPVAAATSLPDELLQYWKEGIGAGALSHLLRVKDAAWYDPGEAKERANQFSAAITNAKLQSMRNFQVADLRVDPQPFIVRRR